MSCLVLLVLGTMSISGDQVVPEDGVRADASICHHQIVLYAILSFIREIFLGQQGVLTMMADK